jgi:predicted glycoside hydrolase/deacetylase ChbG (UPF0249 family)
VTRLVLTADDAGLAAPLSRRIASLLASGRLSATSLLACGAAFDEAVDALRAAGVAEAGVHLCLVGGESPVLPAEAIPTIAPGGRFFRSWPAVAARVDTGLLRIAEVEEEWEAQLLAVRRAGFRVTHLDSHQHVHLLPGLLRVVVRLARRYDVPFVRAPRADDPAAFATGTGPVGRGRAKLLSLFGAAARTRIAEAGLPEPPRVLGLAEAGRMTLARWTGLLERLPGEGTFEVVLHPGVDDPAAEARYGWGYAWEEESSALENEELTATLAARGVEVVPFSALTPPA